jgi:hypothetical protein
LPPRHYPASVETELSSLISLAEEVAQSEDEARIIELTVLLANYLIWSAQEIPPGNC